MPQACAGAGNARRQLLLGAASGVALGLAGIGLARAASAASTGQLEAFARALPGDDRRAVAALLAQGLDPNTVDARGNSLLYVALQHHALRIAALLLAQPGLRLNQRNPAGETALMIACLRGDAGLAEDMLRRGAQLQPPPGQAGWTALSYAATNGQDRIVRLLLAHGARVDQPAANGTTPLMMAAYFGHAATVRLLLAAGADPRLRNRMGYSAMDLAMRRHHRASAEALGRALDRKRKPGQW